MADLKKLRKAQAERKAAEAERGTGEYRFLGSKDLDGEGKVLRILDAVHDNMYDVFYFKEVGFWLGNTRVVSKETFDEHCVIKEEIAEARSKDEDGSIADLLNSREFSDRDTYVMNVLEIDPETDEVVGDQVSIFNFSQSSIFSQIEDLAVSPDYCKKSDNGILDRKYGRNLRLTREGKKLDTKYYVKPLDPSSISKKWFKPDNVPDLVELAKSKIIQDDDEARAIIRNFLYGEEIPEKSEKKKKKKKKKIKVKKKKK